MTSMIGSGEVLKSDTKGRVRVPAERQETLLDEFERSGLSALKFAALVGVKYATFAYWVQRRRRARLVQPKEDVATPLEQAGGSRRPEPVRLLEVFAESGRSSVGVALRIELPGGARVVLDSPAQLPMAVELLGMLNCGGRR
jgi:hypothetical protein